MKPTKKIKQRIFFSACNFGLHNRASVLVTEVRNRFGRETRAILLRAAASACCNGLPFESRDAYSVDDLR